MTNILNQNAIKNPRDIVGETFNNFKVLEYLGARIEVYANAHSQRRHIYKVICTHCDRHHERPRADIVRRIPDGRKRCRYCVDRFSNLSPDFEAIEQARKAKNKNDELSYPSPSHPVNKLRRLAAGIDKF